MTSNNERGKKEKKEKKEKKLLAISTQHQNFSDLRQLPIKIQNARHYKHFVGLSSKKKKERILALTS